MKKILILLLCLALLPTFSACSNQTQQSTVAEQQCEEFLGDIRRGKGLAEQLISEGQRNGIMEEVLGSVRYEILSQEKQDDGSILCTLEISAIDMEELLEALPNDLTSEEEARAAMLDLVEDAERTTFEAELLLVPVEGSDEYSYQYGNDLVNAVTGGMLELIMEAYDIEVLE